MPPQQTLSALDSSDRLGTYRLVEELGRGGMGTVYKAYDPALDRYVAIKVLLEQFARAPQFLARFRQEAKAIARLNHPNILPIFHFGEEGSLLYIVMRYVEGGTLKELVGRPICDGMELLNIESSEWATASWKQVEIGLAGYSGIARLRFSLEVDRDLSYKGWVIDEVKVSGEAATPAGGDVFLPVILKDAGP